MKHIIFVTLAIGLVFGFTACGEVGSADTPSHDTSAQASNQVMEYPKTISEENNGDELAYWDGFDFGENLTYDEAYEMQGDPGDYMDCAESAKVVFDEVRDNGNIDGYSDSTEYKMTLIDLADINGEECRVYRCEGGDFAAEFAFAYQSGGIYMQGQGGAWVKLLDFKGSLYSSFLSEEYLKTMETPDVN